MNLLSLTGLVQGTEQWYEIQDLMVRETMPQLISLSETYIQIYGITSSLPPISFVCHLTLSICATELIDMPPMPAPTLPPP
jgi:hypothetical protein